MIFKSCQYLKLNENLSLQAKVPRRKPSQRRKRSVSRKRPVQYFSAEESMDFLTFWRENSRQKFLKFRPRLSPQTAILQVMMIELVHSVETEAPKWLFTTAPKMEGWVGRGERDYRWTLTDEYRGDPDLRGEVISALSFFNFGAWI